MIVIATAVNLVKPEVIRQLRLISVFSEPMNVKQVSEFQTRIFIARFLCFAFYIVRISDQGCLGMYTQSNLLDKILQVQSFQRCPEDLQLY